MSILARPGWTGAHLSARPANRKLHCFNPRPSGLDGRSAPSKRVQFPTCYNILFANICCYITLLTAQFEYFSANYLLFLHREHYTNFAGAPGSRG